MKGRFVTLERGLCLKGTDNTRASNLQEEREEDDDDDD